MIKFTRIHALGKERVMVINNKLANGASTYEIARLIQQDWKEFLDVAEKTLAQQLGRYKGSLATAVKETTNPDTVVVTTLVTKVNVVSKLAELESMLKTRIQAALAKEKGLGGLLMGQLSKELSEYRQLLLDIQKVQFDLGIDEYRGPLLQARAGVQTTTLPDGTVIHSQVAEAVQVAQNAIARISEGRIIDAEAGK